MKALCVEERRPNSHVIPRRGINTTHARIASLRKVKWIAWLSQYDLPVNFCFWLECYMPLTGLTNVVSETVKIKVWKRWEFIATWQHMTENIIQFCFDCNEIIATWMQCISNIALIIYRRYHTNTRANNCLITLSVLHGCPSPALLMSSPWWLVPELLR